MLEFADENGIILLSMPSHTSHYLQPLDVAVFKSLKTHFYEQCRHWINRKERRITRLQFGELLNQSWGKAASIENATSGFKATGVFPLNPNAIPEYAFRTNPEVFAKRHQDDQTEGIQSNTVSEEPIPNTSKTQTPFEKPTPTKVLHEVSPLPKNFQEVRKRAKHVSILLTSPEHIEKRKIKEKEKTEKEEKSKISKATKQEMKNDTNKENKTVRKRKAIRRISDSSCEEIPMNLCDSTGSENGDSEEDNCRVEAVVKTIIKRNSLKTGYNVIFVCCGVHENCTEFEDMCSHCGNKKKNELKGGKGKGKGKKSTGRLPPI